MHVLDLVVRRLMTWPLRFFRTWPVAAVALGGLLVLIYTSVATTSRKAEEIYAQLDASNRHHREVEIKLRQLRADVYESGIYIRDYLLDHDQEDASAYRTQLTKLRANHSANTAELRRLLPPRLTPQVDVLDRRIDEYWQTFDPIFEWTLYEKVLRSARFLRREVLPRREAVLSLTRDIERLNNANVAVQRAEVARRLVGFRDDLHRRLLRTLLLGLVVALVAVLRLRALERRSARQREHAEEAERQMRALSQQLVAAQEEERKKITRELHDHVGQMLTALRLEIGRADRARGRSETQLAQAIVEAKRLLDMTLRSVRDLVMGLRPSMLDDFGLRPALEWQVRDFRRRVGVPIELRVHGEIDSLPDAMRTAVYRIVQEALTNCARHAQATQVELDVRREPESLELVIADDGVGLAPQRARGMGLIGIDERVRELHGTFTVRPNEPRGTRLSVSIPVFIEDQEVSLARVVGG